jgi:FG-GAP-like repeat
MHRRSLLRLLLGLGILNPISALDSTHRGFDDVAAASGVRFTHVAGKTSEKYLPESMGAGVAVLDYNSDGFLDLFFVNGAALRNPMPAGVKPEKSDPRYWNRLFRNQGDGTFTDVTLTSGLRGEGYGMGAAVGDFNNDGLPDLYVTSLGQNHLYRNMGDGGFSDVTEKAGVGAAGWSAGACFADYDRDGYLDLIVVRYLDWDFSRNPYCGDRRPGYRSYCHPDQFKPDDVRHRKLFSDPHRLPLPVGQRTPAPLESEVRRTGTPTVSHLRRSLLNVNFFSRTGGPSGLAKLASPSREGSAYMSIIMSVPTYVPRNVQTSGTGLSPVFVSCANP